METRTVNERLLITEESIWQSPRVVEAIRAGKLSWELFFRQLCDDLAMGLDYSEWAIELAREGSLSLAYELAEAVGEARSLIEELDRQRETWQVLVQEQRIEVKKRVDSQLTILDDEEREDIERLFSRADEWLGQELFGRASDALEDVDGIVATALERRRRQEQKAYETAELHLMLARDAFRRADPFPGGEERQHQARELLSRASDLILASQFGDVMQICGIVQVLCEGKSADESLIRRFIREPAIGGPELIPAAAVKPVAEPSALEKWEFEHDWTTEDDEYLIDNYDRLSNGQLALKLIASQGEIEKRLEYLGLTLGRLKGKRRRRQNPYVAGRPLRTKKVFYGREDIFNFIGSALGKEAGADEERNLVVLEGHRRTGKTSILLQLCKNRREILAPRIPVFVDMEGLLPFPGGTRNFFYKLAYKIYEYLSDNEGIRLPEPQEAEFSDPSWQFQRFLRQAEKAANDVGFVLMLDEFHAIDPQRSLLHVDVYKMLRFMMQHDPRLDFIMAGTMEMERLLREYRAALFGSALIKELTFLDPKDARDLILQPVAQHITYEEDAVAAILDLTSGHPYFVQLICWTVVNYLTDRGKTKVQAADVYRMLPKALDQGIHFAEIWSTDTSELELYLMALAGEAIGDLGGWCPSQRLEAALRQKERFPSNPEVFEEAIQNLAKRRILHLSDAGTEVGFQVDVFRQWVKAKKPMAIVERDIKAEAAKLRRRAERQPINW